MKYIAIIDDDMLNENDKRESRVPILERKEGISYVNLKPLVAHVLTTKDGESIYLTQGDLVIAIYKMLEERYSLIIEADKENKQCQ